VLESRGHASFESLGTGSADEVYQIMIGAASAAWIDIGERQFPLAGKTFTLGRAKDNNVVFTSEKVSRRHAIVHAQGGSEFYLVDLGSSNGTHLNGRRVVQPVALQNGDTIQIGEQSLTFRLEDPATSEEELYLTQPQVTIREINELTCWFLLIDIEKFVQLSHELPTEHLARTIGAWLAECQRVVEQNGGTLSKFLGDGLLAYWNAKFSTVENVVTALHSFQTMQSRRQPPFRWALHYGKAVFGAASAPGELSALGPDLNYLFRIERVAAANGFQTVVSDAANVQISAALSTQSAGSFEIKGLPGSHALFSC